MTPHLLYVAWGYPPSRGAGMYRALATANAFARAGWDVTVLTATRDTFDRLTGSDPDSESSIDPRVSVVRIPFDPPRGETDLRQWNRFRIGSPLLWNYLRSWRARVAFPEPAYGSWVRPLIEATKRIHSSHPVSLVIGTANPHVDFVPGEYLHTKHNIPYVMDYRDTWHLDVYSGKHVGSENSRSARTERRLLQNALEVWFVNKSILEWHSTQYPPANTRHVVVANGYDPEFLEPTRRPDRDRSGELTFGYLGTIYGPMPLRETLEAWRLARSRSDLLSRSSLVIRGRLGHYSTPDPVVAALISEYSHDSVRYEGPVSKTGVSEVYQSFDALLLVLGKSKYVTSGKVFEYAATGLPIASLHHRDTEASNVLRGYPEHFPADEVSVESFAQTLIEMGQRTATMKEQDYSSAQQWAEHLSREQQLAPRVEALTQWVTDNADARGGRT